jgi:periplasmic protein TonB
MFEDSTFESTGRIRTRSGRWMAAALGLNGSILVALILLPLIYPEAIPRFGPMIPMEAPRAPAEQPKPVVKPAHAFHGTPEMNESGLVAPTAIPPRIPKFDGQEGPPPSIDIAGLETGSGVPSGVDKALHANEAKPAVRVAAKGPAVVSSGVMTGQILYKVTPVYPAIARAARVDGTVVLEAVISKAGTIENLRVVSGSPMLEQAALDAVKQWRYRPYQLNGEPVEVETTVNVVFTLGR